MKKFWGKHAGKDVYLFTLLSEDAEIVLTNFGAIITGIWLTDAHSKRRNIVLQYDTLEEYVQDEYYVGSVVGRVTGRLSTAGFNIGSQRFDLSRNAGEEIHLHGGNEGFGKKVFQVSEYSSTHLKLEYFSPDGEEGYPGNLNLVITYTLTGNQFTVLYEAVSDRNTQVNLTNHSYFNLDSSEVIDHHQLQVDADRFVETDEDFIPTGKLLLAKQTRYQFETLRGIGPHPSNECYALRGQSAALLRSDLSGLALQIQTDCPGLLVYTGDYLGGHFNKRQGLCLETQFFPDTPNRPEFSGTLLKAGEEWKRKTVFVFSRML